MSNTIAPADTQMLNLVRSRYGHCCAQPTFFEDFYKDFVSQSAEIRELFKNTNMATQKAALREGVSFLIMYASGMIVAEQKIAELGKSHNRDGYAIRPDQYKIWLDAFLRTVKKHDPQFDAKHDSAWRKVLGAGIAAMSEAY